MRAFAAIANLQKSLTWAVESLADEFKDNFTEACTVPILGSVKKTGDAFFLRDPRDCLAY
jgi:hypothetical protein